MRRGMTEPLLSTRQTPESARERVLHLELHPDRVEWAMFRACISRLRRLDARLSEAELIPMPFLVVTPEGTEDRVRLRDSFLLAGIHVLRRISIPNWARAQTILSVHRYEEDDLLRAWAEEELWRLLYPGDRGECWFLWSPRVCRRLVTDLKSLLPELAGRKTRVTLRDRSIPLLLPPVHVPDEGGLDGEFRRLTWLLDNS